MAPRAGTKTVRPSQDVAPGDTVQVPLGQLKGGPRNQKGYLSKYLPFKAVVVDSYTDGVRLRASVDGTDFDPVPPSTARTFDSVPVYSVYLKNPSGSGSTVAKEDIELVLFRPDTQESGGLNFSGNQLLSDLIPGVQ